MMFNYGGQNVPANTLLCDGQQYPIATYPALAAALGTKYNNASTPATHFCVPNLVNVIPNCDPNNMGGTGGSNTIQVTQANLPNIALSVEGTIKLNVNEEDPDKAEANGNTIGNPYSLTTSIFNGELPDAGASVNGMSYSLTAPTGGQGTLINNRSAYLNVMTCIVYAV